MLDKRLMNLAPESVRHIKICVIWKWISLLSQIVSVSALCCIFGMVFRGEINLIYAFICFTIIIVCMLLRFVCEKKSESASYEASVKVKGILRDAIYSRVLKAGISYREKLSASEIMQLSSEGVEQLEIYFGRYVPQLIYSAIAPITLFAVLCFVSVKAAAVLILCVPLIPISIIFVQKLAKRLLSKYWGIYAKLGDSFLENLQGLTTLKIYSADADAAEKMEVESERFRNITMKVLMMQLNSTSVMDIIAYGGAAIGIAVAVLEFLSGKIDAAQSLMIILLASEFFIPLRLLGSFFHIAMNGMAASEKIFTLLKMPDEKKGEKSFPQLKSEVIIENLNFEYEYNEPVLTGISIKTGVKGMYSFAGESGCGKSTLAGILAGRNTGYDGSIRFDGVELSDIDESALMKYVTLVKHDSHVFKGSVRYNLRIANANASDDEMIDALKKVNLWETLAAKDGLDTNIEEGAANLSGGQRQRLVLARGLLQKSNVFIFDEVTSSVDAESEDIIMSVIRMLAETKLVFLISHRLYNCMESESICYLKHGRIVEMGKHEELLRSCADYRICFEKQMEFENYSRKDDNYARQ